MKDLLDKVNEFNSEIGEPKSEKIKTLDFNEFNLRYKLMKEENDEYLKACEDRDIVEIADSLGDQLYVLLGTIQKHGLQDIIVNVFNEIHRSNMTKTGDDMIFSADGKLLKPNSYKSPNIAKILQDDRSNRM